VVGRDVGKPDGSAVGNPGGSDVGKTEGKAGRAVGNPGGKPHGEAPASPATAGAPPSATRPGTACARIAGAVTSGGTSMGVTVVAGGVSGTATLAVAVGPPACPFGESHATPANGEQVIAASAIRLIKPCLDISCPGRRACWAARPAPMLSWPRMVHKALLFVHLVGFAAYLGAGFAQQRFMARSRATGLAAAIRDEYERLAATVVTKIELPALMAQVATGVAFIALSPDWLRLGWLHGKLGCVIVLLGLSHAEMFNARAIVKARAARGDGANGDIDARKTRHATLGTIGALVVVMLVGLVVYGLG
jgi:uncharacterized membrane protein